MSGPRQPIGGACAWTGARMAHSSRWLRDLDHAAIAEIDRALAHARHLPWTAITAGNFPLPSAKALFADIAHELEEGVGVVKLRGLPVARYDEDDLRRIWFAIGCHLGQPVFQNSRGELMRAIRDEGAGIGQRYGETQSKGGTFLSSYARTLSNGALRFHTDRCDVVGLLCVRQAAADGLSRVCSSAAVQDEMLRRRPDLVEALYADMPRSRFGEEAPANDTIYDLPVFGARGGKFTSHYSLTYIEAAQLVPGVRPLSAAQREGIDWLMRLADELSFTMDFAPGDMQFLNNHVIYHGRTAFTDDLAQGRTRLLLRLWLTVPNNRALPVGHEVLWREIEAGRPRGGIGQTAQTP